MGSNLMSEAIKIRIGVNEYAKVMGYVLASDIEVSGFGQMLCDDDGVFRVTNVHIVKQECTGAETELDKTALGTLEYECEDGEYASKGELLWWWHSHVDMSVFWSGTDMQAMRQISENGRVFATVFNKSFLSRSAYMQGNSYEGLPSLFCDNINLEIVPNEEHVNTVEELVTKKTFTRPIYQHNYGGGYYGQFVRDTEHNVGNVTNISNQLPLNISEPEPVESKSTDEIDDLIYEISRKLGISVMMASDVYDDFEQDFVRPPNSYEEIKKYYKHVFLAQFKK